MGRLGIRDSRDIHVIKAIYNKPIVNIKLSGEKFKQLHKNQEQDKTVCFFHVYSIVLEVLARAIKQLKEIKRIQIGKKEVKVSLFPDDTIVYIRNPKNYTRELL